MATATKTIEYSDAAVEAVSHYLLRQARAEHPAGAFDKAKRFYLAEACGKDCSIRPPSRAWPYSQMTHGRSLEHIARVLGADVHEARSLLALVVRS